jgi:hypothetical protein
MAMQWEQLTSQDLGRAARETGLALRDLAVEELAEAIAAIKADTVVPALNDAFFAREWAVRANRSDGYVTPVESDTSPRNMGRSRQG